MPRAPKTPSERYVDVLSAMRALPDAVETARKALSEYGPTDARTLAAWDAVEVLGAIVHRQSRLLAGKSKGG